VLVGFVFQTILSSGNGILVDMLWTSTAADWVIAVRWILTFYPPFNMAKVYSDIAAKVLPCSISSFVQLVGFQCMFSLGLLDVEPD